jgi:Rap1a immunity proteins
MFRPQLRLGLHGIVVVAALMLSDGTAFAADVASANYVMPGCRSIVAEKHTNLFLDGLCNGLIAGVLYGRSQEVCKPDGITYGQEVRVVVQYIDARPARMHEDFRKLALEALMAAWPCKP